MYILEIGIIRKLQLVAKSYGYTTCRPLTMYWESVMVNVRIDLRFRIND